MVSPLAKQVQLMLEKKLVFKIHCLLEVLVMDMEFNW